MHQYEMRFNKIRITGISTPIFGVSWEYVEGKEQDDFVTLGVSESNEVSIKGERYDKEAGTLYVERDLIHDIEQMPKVKRQFVSIAFVDVDDLTLINKHFDPRVGNEVLVHIGGIIAGKKSLYSYGRCGDDTFYFEIRNAGDRRIEPISEKIRKSVHNYNWGKVVSGLHVNCTIGYAVLCPDEMPAEWVTRAAIAMKNGKENGGNIVQGAPQFAGKDFKPKRRGLTSDQKEVFYPDIRSHFS